MQNERGMIEDVLQTLVRFRTDPEGNAHAACAAWLTDALDQRGFDVEVHEDAGRPPIVRAHRAATQGGSGHLVMYGHYDVDEVSEGWVGNPFALAELEGRWIGLGVGDNKGALAARLVALAEAAASPRVTVILQGEEETGSHSLRTHLQHHPPADVDWWLDENGWRDPNGVERLLMCRISGGRTAEPSVEEASRIMGAIHAASPAAVEPRLEGRLLNKRFVPGGCAFQALLPDEASYLALGTNDAATRIHAAGESIAIAAAVHHARVVKCLLEMFAGKEAP